LDALNFAGGGSNFATVSEGLTQLDAMGVLNRQDFIGLDDLSQFRFFSNSFDTTTSGIDVVANYSFSLGEGESRITFAGNYNKTEVDDVGTINPISAGRVQAIEDLLPNVRYNLEWTHSQDVWRTLVRLNYFGEWDDTGNGVNGIGAEFLVDVEFLYALNENLDLVAGVSNLFDTYPDRNPSAGSLGQLYPEASPFGFNGGQWYLQARVKY
jgi:iron complex outermembrane receptor protein